MASRTRADQLLVEQGLAETPDEAARLIMTGQVIADLPGGGNRRIEKRAELLPVGARVRRRGQRSFVSRSGHKLAAALDAFSVDPQGRVALDVGLSTGGFTDCLLSREALRVHGVDVGYGDVDWRLRNDPRLVLHERTNARHLPKRAFGEPVSLAVIDVSFISLRLILPAVVRQLSPRADVMALVKPQFEAKPEEAPSGVVHSETVRRRVLETICDAAGSLGLRRLGHLDSPVAGADGNREILVHFQYLED